MSLNLSHTSMDVEEAKRLATILAQDQGSIRQLQLDGNPLGAEGIFELLPHCGKLKALSLVNTGCRGDLVHRALCALLQRTESLESLQLSQNLLGERPLRRMAQAVAGCASLTSLALERTGMNAEGVMALCDALVASPTRSLTELDLSDNRLGQGEEAAPLARLVESSGLQVLRLNRNPLGDTGAHRLARALDPAMCSNAKLRCLELSSCRVGVPGAARLLAGLARNPRLRVLCLMDNFLDDSLDPCLLDQLEHLQELQVSGNRLSHATMQRAAQVCARNRQRERDREAEALRAEVLRLLPEEAKLGRARQQVEEDEAELGRRRGAAECTQQELQALRAAAAEHQRQRAWQLSLAEAELASRREELQRACRELEETAALHERTRGELYERLRGLEQELVDLQVNADQVDELLRRRKAEHPLEVVCVKARIKAATEETDQLRSSANVVRRRLEALQKKTLIDFRP